MCGDTPQKSAPESESEIYKNIDFLRLFEIYRDYMKHEDELIHQRISRTLIAQVFLMASYVLLMQAKFRAYSQISLSHLPGVQTPSPQQPGSPLLFPDREQHLVDLVSASHWILLIIALLGVSVSVAAFFGVNAAVAALKKLNKKWIHVSKKPQNQPHRALIPKLSGGDSRYAHKLGIREARGLAAILIGLWIGILCVTVVFNI